MRIGQLHDIGHYILVDAKARAVRAGGVEAKHARGPMASTAYKTKVLVAARAAISQRADVMAGVAMEVRDALATCPIWTSLGGDPN